jgi:dienelactone hydrolase
MTVVKQFRVVPLLVVLLAVPLMAEKKEVTIPAGGVNLKGTLFLSSRPGPGIVVLHECNADRQLYDNLGTMLSTAGYNVLAFDFRMDRMPADVDAAFGFLTSQSLVNSRALGIVAGSCSVNEAVHASQRHPDVRTLVVLSGGADAAGEAYIKDSPKLSIFGVASEEDTEAAAAVKKLVGVSSNNYKQVEMFKGAGHAASMFEKQPDLEADIVIWFRSNLPVGGYGLPPAIK